MTDAEDRAAIKRMINENYAMLSGPPGPRAYDGVKHHFHPDSRLVRTGVDTQGAPFANVMSVDEHHADVDAKLAATHFVEAEISHECEVFGDVAHAKSVYRFQYGEGAAAVRGRGVNFFNLIRLGGAWKIMSIVWCNERPGVEIGASS